jgi:hypothetical protein
MMFSFRSFLSNDGAAARTLHSALADEWRNPMNWLNDGASDVKWSILVAACEAGVTGLVLLISPPLFGWLIFGAELSEAGQALSR